MTTERQYQQGELLLGSRYRVLRLIGSGGMGSVYEVEHIELGKRFVLKLLLPEFSARSDLVLRLRNEWRALGRLEHPNIVNVTDAGLTSDGQPYYVMERLEGETLAQRLSHLPRMQVPDALSVACQLLDGLAAAHDIGVVHRDIKPPNIFLQSDGGLKLLDFGIAKILDGEPGIVTARGLVIGTPRFMAPEQALGGRIDGRSDLYAVGLLLFEMIAGVGPFDRVTDQNQVVLAHINQPAPRLSEFAPGVAAALDDLVASLLAKHARDRPSHARGVAAVLRALADRYAALGGSPDVSTVVADYHGVTLGVGESSATLVDSTTGAVPSSAVLSRPEYVAGRLQSSEGLTVSDGELSGGDTLLADPPSSALPGGRDEMASGARFGFAHGGERGGDTLHLNPTPLPPGAAEPTRTQIPAAHQRATVPVLRDPAGNQTPPPVEQGLWDGQRAPERRSYTRLLVVVGLVALVVGAASAVLVKRMPRAAESGRVPSVEPATSAAAIEVLALSKPDSAKPDSDRASQSTNRGAQTSAAKPSIEPGDSDDPFAAGKTATEGTMASAARTNAPQPPRASTEREALATPETARIPLSRAEPQPVRNVAPSTAESRKKAPSERAPKAETTPPEQKPAKRPLPASGL